MKQYCGIYKMLLFLDDIRQSKNVKLIDLNWELPLVVLMPIVTGVVHFNFYFLKADLHSTIFAYNHHVTSGGRAGCLLWNIVWDCYHWTFAVATCCRVLKRSRMLQHWSCVWLFYGCCGYHLDDTIYVVVVLYADRVRWS